MGLLALMDSSFPPNDFATPIVVQPGRIGALRTTSAVVDMCFVLVIMPGEKHPATERECGHAQLKRFVQSLPRRCCVPIFGDFNAHPGGPVGALRYPWS